MKKAYTKPMLIAEDFRLSQSVAYGCIALGDSVANHRTASACSYQMPGGGVTLFYDTANGCDATYIGDAPTYDCYNGPSDNFQLFAS